MRGIFRGAALGLAFVLVGCQAPLLRRLPAGDPRADALLARFTTRVSERLAMRSSARLSVDSEREGPDGVPLRVRSKQRVVLARPARLRVEVQGLLGTTLAVLTIDDEEYAWFESESRHFESGPVYDALLWNMVGLDLTPAEAVEVVLGAPRVAGEFVVLAAWDLGGGVTRIALGEPGGAPTRSIDLDDRARLLRFAVFGDTKLPVWEARFDDYALVSGSPLARRIRIETGSGTHAVLSLSNVELNPPLTPDIFRLERVALGLEGEGG